MQALAERDGDISVVGEALLLPSVTRTVLGSVVARPETGLITPGR